MALKGNGTSDKVTSSNIATTPTRWSITFSYMNTVVPGSAVTDTPWGVGTAARLDYGFAWDNTSTIAMGAIFQTRASTSSDAAQIPGASLLANTWYRIGGRYDGTNLSAWLDGVKVAEVASADPATTGPVVCVFLGLQIAGYNDDGAIAWPSYYNVALTDREMAALGKGFHGLLVRPQGLLLCADFYRSARTRVGGPMTVSGTSILESPRIIHPSPRHRTLFPRTIVASSFLPQYAAGSNVILGTGARAA